MSLIGNVNYGMDPLELVPELNDIFFEIKAIFEKRKINKAEAVLVLSQCIGAISAEIILAKDGKGLN